MSEQNCIVRVNTYRARIIADFDSPSEFVGWNGHRRAMRLKGWSLFLKVCERLTRDGVEFTVALSHDGEVVNIRGTWTKARKHKPTVPKMHLPAPVKAEMCRKQASEAQCGLRAIEARRALRESTPYDEEYRESLTAELEYWREMELCAETRDKWRPGLDEARHAEDEEIRLERAT